MRLIGTFETIESKMIKSDTNARIQKTLKVLTAIWDVLYGLFSYLRLALELFWEEYGQQILTGFAVFLLFMFETSTRTFAFGRKARGAFDKWLAQRLDSAFFRLVDIQ